MAKESGTGPRRLGELERSVMDVLWAAPAEGRTAQELVEELSRDGAPELAATTVLTVLDRLRRKDFVHRERAGRSHRYMAAQSRDDVVASSMIAVLETTDDRRSALVRFAGAVSAEEAALLREALAELEP
jgi:predicted transcriptional regulator